MYSTDHHFSQKAAECFRAIGDCDFVTPVSQLPWSARSLKMAKIAVYEKYLRAEDAVRASWIQKQAQTNPDAATFCLAGTEFIYGLLDQRSGGTWYWEMLQLARTLPSADEHAAKEFGYDHKPPYPNPPPTLQIVH